MQYDDQRRDLRPLSSASAKKIELVVARHEVTINDVLLGWHGAASAGNAGQRTLTGEQQSELQNLLIEMSIEVCKAEGGEYLASTSSPRQFEIEIAQIVDAIASETHARWRSLTRDFLLSSPSHAKSDLSDFHIQVREALKPVARRLIRDAWSDHKRRLEAECACPIEAPGKGTPQTPHALTPPAKRFRLELVSRNIDRLRIDRGMSIEELAVEAGLDKKTVAALVDGRRHARINTVKKLADALGVKASELAS